MADHFDEELKRSLTTQASRVPGAHDLGRTAITRARSIRRRRRVVGGVAAAALVAIAVPVGLQVGDAVTRTGRQIAPATGDTAPPSVGPTSEPPRTTEPEPTATEPTATEPPEQSITGPTRVDIDFSTLPTGQPPLVPYLDGRTIFVLDSSFDVAGDGSIGAFAAFDGGAHVFVSQEGIPEIVRVTADGTMRGLGHAAATLIASRDLRWNAYATGETDNFGNVKRGIRLWLYGADGSTSTLELPEANGVRLIAVVDGTIYFRPERPDGSRQPLLSWTRGQDSPTVVPGSYEATAMSADGRFIAALTEVTDFGSCSQVVDRTSGSALWETCDHTVLGFSAGGEYAWAGPAYLDGYSLGELTLLDGQTGEVIRRLPSLDNDIDFMDATFEDADHLLIRAEQGGQTALVRCSVSAGDCELATPPAEGTSLDGSPYLLTDIG